MTHLRHSKHKEAQEIAHIPLAVRSYSTLIHLAEVDAAMTKSQVAYSLRHLQQTLFLMHCCQVPRTLNLHNNPLGVEVKGPRTLNHSKISLGVADEVP